MTNGQNLIMTKLWCNHKVRWAQITQTQNLYKKLKEL